MEPTLQAALLEKEAWDIFINIAEKYDDGELKDQKSNKKVKPSRRRKKDEITQNQVSPDIFCQCKNQWCNL